MAKVNFFQSKSSLSPTQWITRHGSGEFSRVGTGVVEIVPSPPAGKVRGIVGAPFCPALPIGYIFGSDGLGHVGDVTWTPRIGVTPIGPSRTDAFPSPAPLPVDPHIAILLPGESYGADITVLAGGADRVAGIVGWYDVDLPADVHAVRQTIPDSTPIVLIPVVPAGKTGIVFNPPLSIELKPIFGFIFNADSVDHTFTLEILIGGIWYLLSSILCVAGDSSIRFLEATIPPGSSARIVMQEPVVTLPPLIHSTTCFVGNY
jgi:hypothetical protein